MADALISIVLEQLASYALNEVTLTIDARKEVVKLTCNLKLVQAVLVDADEKQVKKEVVRLWLDELKQVAYDADDVLDAWRTRTRVSQTQNGVDVTAGKRKKVLSYLLSPCFFVTDVIAHHDIGHHIKDLNQRLDVIVKQRIDFGLQVAEVHQIHNEPRRLTSSVVDVSKIHGRDQAKEIIMSRLLGENSSQGTAHRVIAIVGVGGLGKTTLARFIFNQERVVENFNAKMWACVSEPFDLVAVAKAIIKEVAGVVPVSVEWQEVHKCLCESIKGKRFLLVLDDVWTEDPSAWNQLKLSLDGGALGSRIMVTTRNRIVAKRMGCVDLDVHELEKLSDNDSWSVIKDVALVGREGVELEEFEELGRKIAAKCKGIPLAITTLASLLCERQTKQEWKNVLSSDLWEMPDIKNFFLPSLLLSYYSLDPVSKQCFLYCAIFPKDFEMSKSYLIRLWMAQGFFGYEGVRDLERIGNNHFYILAMRSFFQDFEKDSNGNIISCKMHDLVHDFAISLSQSDCLFLKEGVTDIHGEKIRHLYARDIDISSILKGTKLRTLDMCVHTAIPTELCNKLVCLRTLVLHGSSLEVLPNELEKLVCLRYLDLSRSKLLELPETVCNLYNLQVLALDWCKNLHKLPDKIENLSNLRHLEIEVTYSLIHLPKTIGRLSLLRSLCKFIVTDAGDGCNVGDLQHLNNLQGCLRLEGLSLVTDENDASRAELGMKRGLREIVFDFRGEGVNVRMKNVLEKLEPPKNLEVLGIVNYSSSSFPGWVQNCLLLTNIVEMSLDSCDGCTELPAFGKMASLEKLKIKSMRSVRHIGREFCGFDAQMTAFPKLKELEIVDMEKLEEWEVPISKDTKIMGLVVEIKLERCPLLRSLPCLGRLESLKKLTFRKLSSVRYIGNELYGFDGDEMIAFPKLKSLSIKEFGQLEEWEIPISNDRKIMPLLSELKLEWCPELRALARVWRMESLEVLKLYRLDSVEGVGVEFGDSKDGVTFPKLRELEISFMDEVEEWDVPLITPCLKKLTLSNISKLKTLPTFQGCVKTLESLEIDRLLSWEGQKKIVINDKEGDLCALRRLVIGSLWIAKFWSWRWKEEVAINSCALRNLSIKDCPSALRNLSIKDCPKLCVVPDYMFSTSLKKLYFASDVGALWADDSFSEYGSLCSITKLTLMSLPYASSLHQLKTLESLDFWFCETLDFDLKELAHFTELQHLDIYECPLLKERFKGDDWRTILAHLPKITIDEREITHKDYKQDDLFS